MLNERWTQSIPDELPDDVWDDSTHDDVVEITKLHSQLRLTIATNQSRRKEAVEKYGVVLDVGTEMRVRLNLLTDMFIGVLSPERLHFEARWQEIVKDSLEMGIAEAQEHERKKKREKTLHLPGGRAHKVDTGEE